MWYFVNLILFWEKYKANKKITKLLNNHEAILIQESLCFLSYIHNDEAESEFEQQYAEIVKNS